MMPPIRPATPITAGKPSERAMMAVWLWAPPRTLAKPAICFGSIKAVSAGVISSAIMMLPSARWPKLLEVGELEERLLALEAAVEPRRLI